MKASNAVLLLSVVVLLSALGDFAAAETATTAVQRTVTSIAAQYVAAHYPNFDIFKNPPIVRDGGMIWIVEYQMPAETLGGTPVIEIEKASFKVLRAYHTQ